jgi:hypothetical protein
MPASVVSGVLERLYVRSAIVHVLSRARRHSPSASLLSFRIVVVCVCVCVQVHCGAYGVWSSDSASTTFGLASLLL